MRFVFSRYFVLCAALVVTSAVLFRTSQSVQKYEREIDGLQAQIAKERERTELLEAEWSYLNTPYRIERLSKQYLNLSPSGTQDVFSSRDISVFRPLIMPAEGGAVMDARLDVSPQYPPLPLSKPIYRPIYRSVVSVAGRSSEFADVVDKEGVPAERDAIEAGEELGVRPALVDEIRPIDGLLGRLTEQGGAR